MISLELILVILVILMIPLCFTINQVKNTTILRIFEQVIKFNYPISSENYVLSQVCVYKLIENKVFLII